MQNKITPSKSKFRKTYNVTKNNLQSTLSPSNLGLASFGWFFVFLNLIFYVTEITCVSCNSCYVCYNLANSIFFIRTTECQLSKVFWNVSQNSKESTCVTESYLLVKRQSDFFNFFSYFEEHPCIAGSKSISSKRRCF